MLSATSAKQLSEQQGSNVWTLIEESLRLHDDCIAISPGTTNLRPMLCRLSRPRALSSEPSIEAVKSMAVEPQMQRKWEEQLAGYVGATFQAGNPSTQAGQASRPCSRCRWTHCAARKSRPEIQNVAASAAGADRRMHSRRRAGSSIRGRRSI